MPESQFHLLQSRRFLPLFVTQFLGAMNDNLFKQALVVLVTFRLAQALDINGQIFVTVAAGVFILPFFLFSATAGQLADKYEKSRSIRIIKAFEIAIMSLAVMGYYTEAPYFLMAVLFLMGTQSAFFGPLKYSILPDHLRDDELIGGNALIEGATFLAILIGTIAGGLIILTERGTEITSIAVVAFAVLGWATSRSIPEAPAAAPDLKVSFNIATETWRMIGFAREKKTVFMSVLGISWFWVVGATFLSQFPNFTKLVLGGDETVVTLFMAMFSIGIGLGSLWCNKLLGGKISARYVAVGGLAMTAFMVDLAIVTWNSTPAVGSMINASGFMAETTNWRILFDLLAISMAAGIYTVPLYAILQHDSERQHRSRTIAANNILNALFMVLGSLVVTWMLGNDWSIPQVFLMLAIANACVAGWMMRLRRLVE